MRVPLSEAVANREPEKFNAIEDIDD